MLDGKRIAILVENGFEDLEIIEPMRAMKAANARVIFIGADSRLNYRSKSGKRTIAAEMTVDKAKADDFDVIIIPVGHVMEGIGLCQATVALVREAYYLGKVVAAICHGPRFLVSADIVRGRRMTSWHSIAIELRNAGADWVDEPVVQDGNIITSGKPADLPMFNRAIIDAVIAGDNSSEIEGAGEQEGIPI